jgi:spore cortex formation protein SpoVR/YcgB (stage V sporulation)
MRDAGVYEMRFAAARGLAAFETARAVSLSLTARAERQAMPDSSGLRKLHSRRTRRGKVSFFD